MFSLDSCFSSLGLLFLYFLYKKNDKGIAITINIPITINAIAQPGKGVASDVFTVTSPFFIVSITFPSELSKSNLVVPMKILISEYVLVAYNPVTL